MKYQPVRIYPKRTNCIFWAWRMRIAYGGKIVFARSDRWPLRFHVCWTDGDHVWSYVPLRQEPLKLWEVWRAIRFKGQIKGRRLLRTEL